MGTEQLILPRLKIPHRGSVAVFIGFKDIESDDPKILLAQKPSGRYTFPGGKSRFWEKPLNTAIRETKEETGWKIYNSEYLISSTNNPVRIAVDGCERDMYIFFGFTDECMDNNTPQHREPTKNTPWEWIPVRRIPSLVAIGQLHPMILKAELPNIVKEAHEVCEQEIPPKDVLDRFAYDFPHYGLHPDLL